MKILVSELRRLIREETKKMHEAHPGVSRYEVDTQYNKDLKKYVSKAYISGNMGKTPPIAVATGLTEEESRKKVELKVGADPWLYDN